MKLLLEKLKTVIRMLSLSRYPTLDLHGETRDTIYTLLKQFIQDNVKLKQSIVVVVHGKSSQILKKEVHYYLSKMKEIETFHLDYWNNGVTVIQLKI